MGSKLSSGMQNIMSNKKMSMKNIKRAIKASGMSDSDQKLAWTTAQRMNSNPHAVTTGKMTSALVGAMADGKVIKSKYKNSPKSVVSLLRKAHDEQAESEKKKKNEAVAKRKADREAKKAASLERKKVEDRKKKREERMKMLARESRAEADKMHEASVKKGEYSLDSDKRKAKVSGRLKEKPRPTATPPASAVSGGIYDMPID